MTLNERILRAIAGGALLGAVGCQPSTVPDPDPHQQALTPEKESSTTAAPADAEEAPTSNDEAKSETATPLELPEDARPDAGTSTASSEKLPECAAPFTEDELTQALDGKSITKQDVTLNCKNTCRELHSYSSGFNGGYRRVCKFEVDEKCCQVQVYEERRPYRGRPFIVDGEARTGELAVTDAWASRIVVDCDLCAADREAVADVWAEAGTEEHASIASFSQFMMDLMSLGAPPELIQETARAISDEVLHAQACFGIASALRGAPVGPGPVSTAGVQATRSPEAILRAALREGCVGETLAAHLAGWLAPKAIHPTVHGVLEGIAADEGAHAALAWQFAAWMLATRPELRWVVEEEFAAVRRDGSTPAVDGPDLSGWGVASPAAEAELSARAIDEILVPAFETLLA